MNSIYNTDLEILPLKRVSSDLADSLLLECDDLETDDLSMERSTQEMNLLASNVKPFEITENPQGLEISIYRDSESIIIEKETGIDVKKYIIIGGFVVGGIALGGPLGGLLASKVAISTTALVATGTVTGGALGGGLGSRFWSANNHGKPWYDPLYHPLETVSKLWR